MGILLLLLPVAGALSDRVGRKPLLVGAAAGALVLAWPLFWLMHHPSASLAMLGQLGFAVLLGFFLGALPTTLVEALPGRVRCSALSVAYNLCVGVIGGMTPMATAFLLARSHDDLSPAYFVMAAAAVSLAVAATLRETAGEPLR
jgi:MHS family proline/betaine transporter-like MFS transporter